MGLRGMISPSGAAMLICLEQIGLTLPINVAGTKMREES